MDFLFHDPLGPSLLIVLNIICSQWKTILLGEYPVTSVTCVFIAHYFTSRATQVIETKAICFLPVRFLQIISCRVSMYLSALFNPFTPIDVIGHRKQFSSSSSTWLSRKWPVVDGSKPFGCGQMQNIQTLLWKVLNTHQTPLGLPKGHLMNPFNFQKYLKY